MAASDDTPPPDAVVEFRLDGRAVRSGGGDRRLIDVLRELRGPRAVRAGCGAGQCGTCAVLVDGERATSCDRTLATVARREVTTPQADTAAWQLARDAFSSIDAGQCGYCVPGFVAATVGLAATPHPVTDADLRATFDEHLCRCGAYPRLLQAARRVLGIAAVPAAATTSRARAVEPSDDISACELIRIDDDAVDARPAQLPPELTAAPRVEHWLRFHADGTVQLLSGRSDIGQAVHTALRRVAAATLGVEAARVWVDTPTTATSPNEGFTSGSRSMQQSGLAVALAAATARQILIERARARAPGADEWSIRHDAVLVGGTAHLSIAELVDGDPVVGRIRTDVSPSWQFASAVRQEGHHEFRQKLRGETGYVHDLQPPGLLHARAVIPPHPQARLESAATKAVRSWSQVCAVAVDGSLVLVVAQDEETARRGADTIAAGARWSGPTLRPGPADHRLLGDDDGTAWTARDDTLPADHEELRHFRAVYDKPYQAHAPIAPSAAVALSEDDGLQVWSQTQGIFPLRAELAAISGRAQNQITVHQVPGPGCYGHNAADDAAAFAMLAADIVPGQHVRFAFEPWQEFVVEPYGSAMRADVDAWVTADGKVAGWRHDALTDAHGARPRGQGDRLIPAWLRAGDVGRPELGASGGGGRNLDPIYAFDAVHARARHVDGPLRTSSLRSLGAVLHVFAIESMMDEIAAGLQLDPVELRRRHLQNDRARRVLDEALRVDDTSVPSSGAMPIGRGVALARYAGDKAYAAVVARVAVDLEASLLAPLHLTVAVDAGAVVDADGLRQQLEGGVVHGLSRTFGEELRVDRTGVVTTDWASYRVARASQVPGMRVVLLDRPGSRPLGAGEATTPLVAPAIANAIADACGVRLRSLPFTPERVRDQLLRSEQTTPA
ncbi:molybdopterin cofactor-binding domain-containing protein [Egicoccus sp. AB-alg2]|uniref:molybdopterin-dependent oxidoreductase n=1 Tax=Egicoccus sp. AB-alg2 TaxID=3242693 RepID=UPI00359DEF9C